MKKASSSDDDYIIFVKYKDINDLKNTVYEIFREIENEADTKNCFTEGNASCDELVNYSLCNWNFCPITIQPPYRDNKEV